MIDIGLFMWVFTLASIIGVIANIHKKAWCFKLWLVTNSAWMLYDFYLMAYAQAFLFGVYVILAVYGIVKWKPEPDRGAAMIYQEWWEEIEKPCKYPIIRDQGSARCSHPFFNGAFAWCDMMNCPELMGK